MQSLPDIVKNRPRTYALYAGFCLACCYIYSTLVPQATGTHDFLLTFSAGLQALAFTHLVSDTHSKVADGLSEKTLWAFLISHVSRISTTCWGEGYVPEDNTSSYHLYQVLEVGSVLLLGWKILNVKTARGTHDMGQGFDSTAVLVAMVVMSLVLAGLTKSTGHNDYFADLSWMFSVWLEAFALVPQVRLLTAANHVDEGAVHFAGATLASSLVFAVFWWKGAVERSEELLKDGYHAFLFGIVAAALIRCSLCCIYFHLFVRTARTFAGGESKKGEYELCVQEDEL